MPQTIYGTPLAPNRARGGAGGVRNCSGDNQVQDVGGAIRTHATV